MQVSFWFIDNIPKCLYYILRDIKWSTNKNKCTFLVFLAFDILFFSDRWMGGGGCTSFAFLWLDTFIFYNSGRLMRIEVMNETNEGITKVILIEKNDACSMQQYLDPFILQHYLIYKSICLKYLYHDYSMDGIIQFTNTGCSLS